MVTICVDNKWTVQSVFSSSTARSYEVSNFTKLFRRYRSGLYSFNAKMLGEKYRLKIGLSGVIEGSLPIGGLSSSASVIICFLSALCKVNDIHLEPMELILTAKAAENQYVGVSCGKLDQSCEVLSKKNHLLYLDTKDDSYM